MKQDIEVIIDELVLDGFDLSQKYAILDALERELGSLLSEKGLLAKFDQPTLKIDRLDAGSISLRPEIRSASVGSQLGRALFASLNSSTISASHEKSPAPGSEKSGQTANPMPNRR